MAAPCALLALLGAGPRALITFPVTALVLMGLRHHAHWTPRNRGAFVVFLVVALIGFGWPIAVTLAHNVAEVPEFDYLGFWLHARTAVLGWNFYDPTSAETLVAPFNVTGEFLGEIVEAGFWYPPPSMFLFLPLGFFDQAAVLPWWYAFHGLVAAGVVMLLKRTFFPAGGAVEWLACAALVVAMHGTETTFRFSQTTFVALAATLLAWRRPGSVGAGVWTTVALLVKPFLAALAVPPLVGGKWRTVATAAISLAVLMAASALVFDIPTFLDYFSQDHFNAKPDWIYHQPTNQSLLGLVLRSTSIECVGTGCILHPIFLVSAAVLGLATLVLGIRLARSGEIEWALSLWLLLALLIYPVSQLYYSPLLIPPLLLAWSRRDTVPGGAWVTSLVIATVFALAALNDGEATVFAYLLAWTAMAVLGTRLVRGRVGPAEPASAHGG